MDAMQESRGIDRFVLIGLCSGAVTAFDAAGVDDRVAGVVMINPQGFDLNPEWNGYIASRGDARRYWKRSLFSAASWWHALTGRVDYRRLVSVLWRQASGPGRAREVVSSIVTRVGAELQKLMDREVRTLLVCSEGDDGIEYMNVILQRDVRTMTLGRAPDGGNSARSGPQPHAARQSAPCGGRRPNVGGFLRARNRAPAGSRRARGDRPRVRGDAFDFDLID